MRHDLRRLIRQYRKQGWRIDYNKRSHLVWTSPAGVKIRTASTPSDRNAIKAIQRDLIKCI